MKRLASTLSSTNYTLPKRTIHQFLKTIPLIHWNLSLRGKMSCKFRVILRFFFVESTNKQTYISVCYKLRCRKENRKERKVDWKMLEITYGFNWEKKNYKNLVTWIMKGRRGISSVVVKVRSYSPSLSSASSGSSPVLEVKVLRKTMGSNGFLHICLEGLKYICKLELDQLAAWTTERKNFQNNAEKKSMVKNKQSREKISIIYHNCFFSLPKRQWERENIWSKE